MNKENKRFIIETILLKEVVKYDLSLKEFVILMYFDNEYDGIFDVKKISKATGIAEKDVLGSFGSLLDRKLIKLISEKNESGKMMDKVSLEPLYSGIKASDKKTTRKSSPDIFTTFQKKYKKSLSAIDFELINSWISSGCSEDLIIGALDEANASNVTSLRYIGKILFDWKKRGFKSMRDVENGFRSRYDEQDKEKLAYESQILEFNWLDED